MKEVAVKKWLLNPEFNSASIQIRFHYETIRNRKPTRILFWNTTRVRTKKDAVQGYK